MIYQSDGVVDRASASEAVDADSSPMSGQAKDLRKLAFTASLLGIQHQSRRQKTKTKPASSLGVSLGKALNGTPLALSGRR